MYHLKKIEFVDDSGNRYVFNVATQELISMDKNLDADTKASILYSVQLLLSAGTHALPGFPEVSSLFTT